MYMIQMRWRVLSFFLEQIGEEITMSEREGEREGEKERERERKATGPFF